MTSDDDEVAVEARITTHLRALVQDLDVDNRPPAPYLRRHLVEHAAAGNRLDDRVVTADLLPYMDIQRLRTALSTAGGPTLATTARIVR